MERESGSYDYIPDLYYLPLLLCIIQTVVLWFTLSPINQTKVLSPAETLATNYLLGMFFFLLPVFHVWFTSGP